MANYLQNNRDYFGFAEYWKKHPMSIPVIVLATTSAFLLVLVQGNLDENKIVMAIIFCTFTFLLFLVVIVVLVWKKFVFYNATELVIVEVERYIKTIHESLADVEIGYGVGFDHLRTTPITPEITRNVVNFETLFSLLKNIDLKFEGNDFTKKALAKYYYRNKNYRKGYEWIEKVSDKKDSEYNFIKGLLLWGLDDNDKSRACFEKSTHNNALYYKYLTYITADHPLESELDLYIAEATKPSSPLKSNFFAQLNISHAYFIKATKFPKDDQVLDAQLLQHALCNAERLFQQEKSGLAHFNAACYVSLMGKYKVDLDSLRKFNEDSYCKIVRKYLDEALTGSVCLVKSAASDPDLNWAKEACGEEFYAILGRHYEKSTK